MEGEGRAVDVASLEESIKRVVCIEDSQTGDPGCAAAELEKASSIGKSADFCNDVADETEKVVTVVEPANVEDISVADEEGKEVDAGEDAAENAAQEAASDSDSEDDLQLIVNDEDIYGVEGVEEAETEDLYAVAPGDERYEEMNWSAEMHFHHSQYKYVRPGSGSLAATQSPGVQQDVTPTAKGQQPMPARGQMPFAPYMMNQWAFQPCYEFVLPPSKTVFDIDLDQFEEKPWDYPGSDITDYFNFDFTEESWKHYCEDLARLESETLPAKSRNRSYENGHQAYGDDDMYNMPLQRSRSRGARGQISGRAIQVEGGSLERRPSADMRRQRLRDTGSVIQISLDDDENQEGFRRRRRNEEPYSLSKRDFTRQHISGEQSSGRRGSFPQGTAEMYGSPPASRSSMYSARRGSNYNGFGSGRQQMDTSARPYDRRKHPGSGRRIEQQDGEEDGLSNGSSDSRDSYQYDRSTEEYIGRRTHHVERVSVKRPVRLSDNVVDGETRDRDNKAGRTERRIISSGHTRQLASEKNPVSEEPADSPTLERSQLLSERRRSWQVLSEKRLGRLPAEDDESLETPGSETPVSRRRSLPSTERKSEQTQIERKTQSERKASVALASPDPSPEKPAVKRQSRAELIAERRKAQTIARKRLEEEKSMEAAALAATTETSFEVKATKVVTVKKTESQPRFKRQENAAKDDLRMKVLETVSAKWKMHLRMDDAQAKRKRDKSTMPGKAKLGRQEDALENEVLESGTHESRDEYHHEAQPVEEQLDEYEAAKAESRRSRKRKEKREERKQRHRERAEEESREYYDLDPDDDRADERWQMNEVEDGERESSRYHRRSKKRRRETDDDYYRHEDEEEEEDGEFEPTEPTRRRSQPSRSRSRRRYRDSDYDGDIMEDNEYVEEDGDRWNGYEESSGQRSNKRRRYKEDNEDMERNSFRDGDYEYAHNTADYSMSAEEDVYYKHRDRRDYDDHQPAGRWTGSLQESDEEEYDRFES